jgi:hypothetical protein
MPIIRRSVSEGITVKIPVTKAPPPPIPLQLEKPEEDVDPPPPAPHMVIFACTIFGGTWIVPV